MLASEATCPHRGCCVCLLVGVEALVGWLLDHADVQVTDLSDADTGSEDCSDEDMMEDVDDMAYAVVSAALSCAWGSSSHSMGLCRSGHSRKLLSADWIFYAAVSFSFKTDCVPTSRDVGKSPGVSLLKSQVSYDTLTSDLSKLSHKISWEMLQKFF